MVSISLGVINALKLQLTPEEARRGDVYDDATGKRITKGTTVVGHPTFGIGHNLDSAPTCDAAIDAQFEYDLLAIATELFTVLPWANDLDEPRLLVFFDIAFNAGVHGLLGFARMIADTKAGDYHAAADEILNSHLSAPRRLKLASLMRSA